MMNRILVAVHDSAPALAAASLAIEIGREPSTKLNFVSVSEPGRDTDAILRHLDAVASEAGITPTLTPTSGADHPFEAILAVAREWNADLIVMGRSDAHRPGRPYVGSQTGHLLEFTDIPVLVVPTKTVKRRP